MTFISELLRLGETIEKKKRERLEHMTVGINFIL